MFLAGTLTSELQLSRVQPVKILRSSQLGPAEEGVVSNPDAGADGNARLAQMAGTLAKG
jgi:hypothetical protein